MIKSKKMRIALLVLLVVCAMSLAGNGDVYAQVGKRPQAAKICSDPTLPCRTTATFEQYDLPFQIPASAVIWESEQFYAIILQSVASTGDNCGVFVQEADRLAAQALFPKSKVFASRCTMAGSIFYTNVALNAQFMAVYAGTTKAQADKMLATVKATGKFPGANVRRMKAGFNGT